MSSPRWPHASERRRGSRGVSGSGSTPRSYVPIQVILFVLWSAVDAQFPWFAFPLLGWGDLPRRPRGLRLRDEDSGGDHDRASGARRAVDQAGVHLGGGADRIS